MHPTRFVESGALDGSLCDLERTMHFHGLISTLHCEMRAGSTHGSLWVGLRYRVVYGEGVDFSHEKKKRVGEDELLILLIVSASL